MSAFTAFNPRQKAARLGIGMRLAGSFWTGQRIVGKLDSIGEVNGCENPEKPSAPAKKNARRGLDSAASGLECGSQIGPIVGCLDSTVAGGDAGSYPTFLTLRPPALA